jgi:hypothetical protein
MPYHLNPRFELDTGAAPALLCRCEHCGVVRVPRSQVRAWLSEADVIFLPGLDGWLVMFKVRVARPRSLAGMRRKRVRAARPGSVYSSFLCAH